MFVKGLEGAKAYWHKHPDFEIIAVTNDGEIYLTEGIEDAFSLSPVFANMEKNVIAR